MAFRAGPLDGVRVIDISSSYAAPTTSMYLADMGADVIKIEPVRGDDARGWGPPFLNGEAAWFLSVNRNKRSLCLDIRSDKGKEVLFSLLATADVFIENINPVKLDKHGLGLAGLQERFPQLVICAFSGFGLTGPDSCAARLRPHRPGPVGTHERHGRRWSPQRVSTALSDVAAGTVAAFAVASALVKQQQTGVGEVVDVALLEADLAFMSPRIASFLAGDPNPVPCEGRDSVVAIYQSMRTADRPIVVAIGNDGHWQRSCAALGIEHLAERPDLATNAGRRAKRDEVVGAFQERLETHVLGRGAQATPGRRYPLLTHQLALRGGHGPAGRGARAIIEYEHPWRVCSVGSAQPGVWRRIPSDRPVRRPAPLQGRAQQRDPHGDRTGRRRRR